MNERITVPPTTQRASDNNTVRVTYKRETTQYLRTGSNPEPGVVQWRESKTETCLLDVRETTQSDLANAMVREDKRLFTRFHNACCVKAEAMTNEQAYQYVRDLERVRECHWRATKQGAFESAMVSRDAYPNPPDLSDGMAGVRRIVRDIDNAEWGESTGGSSNRQKRAWKAASERYSSHLEIMLKILETT